VVKKLASNNLNIDINTLLKYEADGLIVKQSHPSLPLYIWNYSRTCQYESKWDEITLNCRALITDHDGNIVARGFKKFFNIEEHKQEDIPNEPFEVFEKLDGSLILGFQYNNQWIFSSKASFTSDQAIASEKLFYELNYNKALSKREGITHVFEYLSDTNRIVVKYDKDRLVLLTMIENKTANEVNIQPLASDLFQKEVGFVDVVKKYDGINDYKTLREVFNGDNREGFVVRFQSGFRIKLKYEEYVRLHRIITNISSYDIWEYLKDDKDIETLLQNVPDEFDTWVKNKIRDLRYNYYSVYNYLGKIHDYYRYGKYNDVDPEPSKKDFALHITKNIDKKYHGILFAMWDRNKELENELIWKLVKPKYEKPFTIKEE
jgi:RNA ligase